MCLMCSDDLTTHHPSITFLSSFLLSLSLAFQPIAFHRSRGLATLDTRDILEYASWFRLGQRVRGRLLNPRAPILHTSFPPHPSNNLPLKMNIRSMKMNVSRDIGMRMNYLQGENDLCVVTHCAISSRIEWMGRESKGRIEDDG